MRQRHNLLWGILLMLLAAITVLTSCGKDDEPDMTIGYYIEVEEGFLVNGTEDHTDRYYNPITMMREVTNTAYPKNTASGDDDAVIKACDELYQRYNEMYTGKAEHLTCLLHLVRADLSGDIVKHSERIRTYNFDINPIDNED